MPSAVQVKIAKRQRARKNWALMLRKVRNPPLSIRQVKAVRKIARKQGELKYYDDNVSSANIYDGSGDLTIFGGVGQGDTILSREGDMIRPQNLRLRLELHCSKALSTTHGVLCRIIVFQLKTGTAPTGLDTTFALRYHLPKMDEADQKYRVFYDRVHSVNQNGQASKFVKINLKGFRPIVYQRGSTTMSSGAIHVLMLADSQTATTTGLRVEGRGRLTYKE